MCNNTVRSDNAPPSGQTGLPYTTLTQTRSHTPTPERAATHPHEPNGLIKHTDIHTSPQGGRPHLTHAKRPYHTHTLYHFAVTAPPPPHTHVVFDWGVGGCQVAVFGLHGSIPGPERPPKTLEAWVPPTPYTTVESHPNPPPYAHVVFDWGVGGCQVAVFGHHGSTPGPQRPPKTLEAWVPPTSRVGVEPHPHD